MHKYASSTPEGRELVTDLEFVWDQIKANSASSSNSSPGRGLAAQTDQQQQHQTGGENMRMSYASLGGLSIERDDAGDGNLRILRPVSEGDEEDDEEELEGEEGGKPADPNAPVEGINPVTTGRKRDLNVRNRKWRKRIEIAIFKMTTELAALREQTEEKKILGNKSNTRSCWAWIRWLIWITIRQLAVDAAILGLLFVWARKNDQRIEQGLWLVLQAVKKQVKRSKLLTIIRLGIIP